MKKKKDLCTIIICRDIAQMKQEHIDDNEEERYDMVF